jgi:hypothetical protein
MTSEIKDFVLKETVKNLCELAKEMPRYASRDFARGYNEKIEAITSPVINVSESCEDGLKIFGFIFPVSSGAPKLELLAMSGNETQFKEAYYEAQFKLYKCISDLGSL